MLLGVFEIRLMSFSENQMSFENNCEFVSLLNFYKFTLIFGQLI